MWQRGLEVVRGLTALHGPLKFVCRLQRIGEGSEVVDLASASIAPDGVVEEVAPSAYTRRSRYTGEGEALGLGRLPPPADPRDLRAATSQGVMYAPRDKDGFRDHLGRAVDSQARAADHHPRRDHPDGYRDQPFDQPSPAYRGSQGYPTASSDTHATDPHHAPPSHSSAQRAAAAHAQPHTAAGQPRGAVAPSFRYELPPTRPPPARDTDHVGPARAPEPTGPGGGTGRAGLGTTEHPCAAAPPETDDWGDESGSSAYPAAQRGGDPAGMRRGGVRAGASSGLGSESTMDRRGQMDHRAQGGEDLDRMDRRAQAEDAELRVQAGEGDQFQIYMAGLSPDLPGDEIRHILLSSLPGMEPFGPRRSRFVGAGRPEYAASDHPGSLIAVFRHADDAHVAMDALRGLRALRPSRAGLKLVYRLQRVGESLDGPGPGPGPAQPARTGRFGSVGAASAGGGGGGATTCSRPAAGSGCAMGARTCGGRPAWGRRGRA